MKYTYRKSQYGRPYERFCRERFPGEAAAICRRAEDFTTAKDVAEI